MTKWQELVLSLGILLILLTVWENWRPEVESLV